MVQQFGRSKGRRQRRKAERERRHVKIGASASAYIHRCSYSAKSSPTSHHFCSSPLSISFSITISRCHSNDRQLRPSTLSLSPLFYRCVRFFFFAPISARCRVLNSIAHTNFSFFWLWCENFPLLLDSLTIVSRLWSIWIYWLGKNRGNMEWKFLDHKVLRNVHQRSFPICEDI